MRVVIDARSAVAAGRTGVGAYTDQLIRRLPSVDPATEYVAWYLNAGGFLRRRRFFADVDAPTLSERGTPIPAGVFNRLVSRFDLPPLEWFVRFDLLFGPNFVPPPTRSDRVVVTVHDVGFRLLPQTAPHAVPWWLRGLARTLRIARRVIVPSDATARDVEDLYGVEPARIDVIPLGVDPDRFRPTAEEVRAVRRSFGLEGPYVVFVGLDPRKNLSTLLEAFGRLPAATRPTLVLVGGVPWDPADPDPVAGALASARPEVRSAVVRTGYVAEPVKAALLHGAEALAYPSRYEGFGLPVLEAMASGTPVLASNVAALTELAGDAALLVDPADPDAIAAGLESVLGDTELRSRLIEAGRTRAAGFPWEATARRTAEVLRSAASTGERI